jgi:hypothetical protein
MSLRSGMCELYSMIGGQMRFGNFWRPKRAGYIIEAEVFVAKWTFIGFLLVAVGAAQAQTSTEPLEQPKRQLLSCSNFKPNADGSWNPVEAVTLGGVTLNPGVSIRPGVSVGGIDLGEKLNANCPHNPRVD